MPEGQRRYVFAPLEQRGLVAGLRAGQVVLLGTGLLADTIALRAAPNPAGAAIAILVLLVVVAAAFVPVGGRAVEQWAPTAARRAARLATGRHRTRPARPPATGRPHRVTASAPGSARAGPGSLLHPPAAFAGLSFGEVDRPGAPGVGLVTDRHAATITAVLAVRGRSFTLLDAEDQERRLSSWSLVLAGMAREGGPVRSLQWVERTIPPDSAALARHLDAALAVPAASAPAGSYAALISEAGAVGRDHECFVALSIRLPRRDGRTPQTALLRELRLLEGQLRNADIEVDRPLSLRELAAVVRTAFDPWSAAAIERRAALHPDLPGPLPATVWPSATDESWSWWRTDDTWHATFWIAEWPRSDVAADFLAPLLVHTTEQRSVAVIMAPLPPSAGVREAEAARTAQAADEQLRARAGFLPTARRLRQAEGVARRESELSDGHAGYHFSGYVTVTVRSLDELESAAGEMLQAAHRCRLELRRLHGVQDLAFTWALPLGRGLAGR